MMSDDDREAEQDARPENLSARRVWPADVTAEIASEHYFTGADGLLGAASAENESLEDAVRVAMEMPPQLNLLTFCVLVLRNGYTVTGESACASPEIFDAELGRWLAHQNAVEKVWPLLGFRLHDQRATES